MKITIFHKGIILVTPE